MSKDLVLWLPHKDVCQPQSLVKASVQGRVIRLSLHRWILGSKDHGLLRKRRNSTGGTSDTPLNIQQGNSRSRPSRKKWEAALNTTRGQVR